MIFVFSEFSTHLFLFLVNFSRSTYIYFISSDRSYTHISVCYIIIMEQKSHHNYKKKSASTSKNVPYQPLSPKVKFIVAYCLYNDTTNTVSQVILPNIVSRYYQNRISRCLQCCPSLNIHKIASLCYLHLRVCPR